MHSGTNITAINAKFCVFYCRCQTNALNALMSRVFLWIMTKSMWALKDRYQLFGSKLRGLWESDQAQILVCPMYPATHSLFPCTGHWKIPVHQSVSVGQYLLHPNNGVQPEDMHESDQSPSHSTSADPWPFDTHYVKAIYQCQGHRQMFPFSSGLKCRDKAETKSVFLVRIWWIYPNWFCETASVWSITAADVSGVRQRRDMSSNMGRFGFSMKAFNHLLWQWINEERPPVQNIVCSLEKCFPMHLTFCKYPTILQPNEILFLDILFTHQCSTMSRVSSSFSWSLWMRPSPFEVALQ